MSTFGNVLLGLLFLGLGVANTFLMFKLWGYPFDHDTLRSSAPRLWMWVHRLTGYAYLGIYIYLMTQMLPRLWSYQIELPARTVAHLTFGMAIGVILVIKIAVVRFFKHLESTLAPFLGTSLLLCSALLIGLSAPVALKEWSMGRKAIAGSVLGEENLRRVTNLLPLAGLPSEAPLERLASTTALRGGRRVLLRKCVQCHDLRTILARPRTPASWVQTVQRMAERSLLAEPISQEEQWFVSTYLIAISPELQQSAKLKRRQDLSMERSRAAIESVTVALETTVRSMDELRKRYSLEEAKETFEMNCAMCHSLSNVGNAPPGSLVEAEALVARMVGNGLNATQTELEQIVFYLTETYAR